VKCSTPTEKKPQWTYTHSKIALSEWVGVFRTLLSTAYLLDPSLFITGSIADLGHLVRKIGNGHFSIVEACLLGLRRSLRLRRDVLFLLFHVFVELHDVFLIVGHSYSNVVNGLAVVHFCHL
jgi:hypothetical protein